MVSGVGGAARWTDAERTRLRELREQGRTIEQAAQAIGRSYRATCRACHEHGIHRRQISKPYTSAEAKTTRAMRLDGMSFEDIAAKLPGRSAESVRKWCHNNRVRRRVDLERIAQRRTDETHRGPHSFTPAASVAQPVSKVRTCMACRKPFTSRHVGNRRCDRCLDNARTVDSPYAP